MGELVNAKYFDVGHAAECIEANRDRIVGVKVRLSLGLADSEDLERLDRAKARGAPILAELAGGGLSCDAAGPFSSRVEDTRASRSAIERALRDASTSPDEVDHVSAHGTGTPLRRF